jgi:hypothetical protein
MRANHRLSVGQRLAKPWVAIVVVALLSGGYFAWQHLHAAHVAAKVYTNVVNLDHELDQLNQQSRQLKLQQQQIQQFAAAIKLAQTGDCRGGQQRMNQLLPGFTAQGFAVAELSRLVQHLPARNCQHELTPIHAQLRVLIYQEHTRVKQFSTTLMQINHQLASLNQQVDGIASTKLGQQELAQLSFMRHKVTKNADVLQQSVMSDVVSDVLDSVEATLLQQSSQSKD